MVYRTKYVPDGSDNGFYVAGMLFQSPFVLKSYAALCTVKSTLQYSIPAVLPKNLPDENKYTEIPIGAKSKYRFMTEHRKYWKVTKIPTGEP
jgi:hypothetical protein